MPVFTEKRRYRPIGWKAHHLGYKQGIELETPPSLGKGIGKAALPRVLPLPPNVLQGREQPVEVKEVRQAVGILLSGYLGMG